MRSQPVPHLFLFSLPAHTVTLHLIICFSVFNDTWIIRQVIHGLIDVELLEGTVSQVRVSSPRQSIRR